MNLEYLKELLLIKARKEQNKYIEELKKLPPEKILEKAYEKVNYVKFENAYYRKDIGKKALEVK